MYEKTIYKVALNAAGNIADAEDITQDTFVALFDSNVVFDDDEHVKRWLIRVAVNKSRDLWKSAWRSRTRFFDELTEPSVTFESEEAELLIALGKLPSKYRVALYLFYYEGYTTGEIAEIAGISEPAARKRLSRARMQLKDLMKEE